MAAKSIIPSCLLNLSCTALHRTEPLTTCSPPTPLLSQSSTPGAAVPSSRLLTPGHCLLGTPLCWQQYLGRRSLNSLACRRRARREHPNILDQTSRVGAVMFVPRICCRKILINPPALHPIASCLSLKHRNSDGVCGACI